MTPEKVFAFSRAYQLYYQGKFDFQKYDGKFPVPPLTSQRDRQFYYRLAQTLPDATIHALFTQAYFRNPKAHVSELVNRDKISAAMKFASRWENGRPLFEAEFYELVKRFSNEDILPWLYENAIPACMQEVINGSLPLDSATMVLLIPQPHLKYDWVKYWIEKPDATLGLGVQPWIDRLKKADRLIFAQRDGWRTFSHTIVKEFWAGIGKDSLKPIQKDQTDLF